MPVGLWIRLQVKEEAAERAMELTWIPLRGQKRFCCEHIHIWEPYRAGPTRLRDVRCFPKYILIRPSTVEESGQPFRLSLGLRRYFSTSVTVP
jgi:hypothetical protein